MSILRTLNVGASGLRSNSDALTVTSDNIANVNTVGFKRSRAIFQDMLGRSVANSFESLKTAGSGSRVAHVEQVWTQGPLVSSDSPTDLAIQGDGFFIVVGDLGAGEQRLYTRAGQFHVDADGRIVNSDGFRLQGYTPDPSGVMSAAIGDLIVEQGTIPARATTGADIAVNLDSNSTVPAIVPFDINNPSGSSNFSNQVTVYDSLGNAHELTVYYNKTGSNTWEWHALIAGDEVVGGVAGTPFEGASGTLSFTTDGALDSETSSASSWDFNGATPGQVIAFDFGNSITTDGGTGLDGTTQFASPSATIALDQDGYASGSIAGISIAKDGTVIGVFSNGNERAIGQIVTADFANVTALERTGQGLWVESFDSGQPLIGPADTGGHGAIIAGTLEQANVDLGTEFVNMIAYQRGFQANSRVITTADEMYGELVNIKR